MTHSHLLRFSNKASLSQLCFGVLNFVCKLVRARVDWLAPTLQIELVPAPP
jgi:hypothetical protein